MAKEKDGNIITEDAEIIKRWRQYFKKVTEKGTHTRIVEE